MMERAKQKEPLGEHEPLLSRNLSRGLPVGKSTPSPVWKLEEEDQTGVSEKPKKPVSVRRLGANLWELRDFIQPQIAGSLRKHVEASLTGHHESNERTNLALLPTSSAAYRSSMEVTPCNPAISAGSPLDLKGRIGDAGYSLKTSTEMLKVLNHIWSLEEQQSSNISLVKALKIDLEQAGARIQELMQEKKSDCREMDDLVNQVVEDRLISKNKEQDRMKAAFHSIREELDDERKLRKRSEILHPELRKELSETRAAFYNTLKDLENERKSNGLLEDLSDELAKGIRQYEKEIRELKMKYTKDCEHKVDGLVLHISEAWLDERLQMQMAAGHGDRNEKDTIVSRLKAEIISFLQARRAENIKEQSEQNHDHNPQRQSLESLHLNGAVGAPHDIEDDDSIAGDLHCFEITMDKTSERGIHDQLKSQCAANLSNSESTRKSIGCHWSFKAKSSSMSQEGLDMQLEGKELSNIINLPTDSIIQKSMNSIMDMDGSNMLNDYPVKKNSENSNYHEEVNHSKFSETGHFHIASSPVVKWNYSRISADLESSESSSKLAQGLKERTLKAKLVEARLEGRHARMKALKGASIASTRQ